jgi:hypothetical protein
MVKEKKLNIDLYENMINNCGTFGSIIFFIFFSFGQWMLFSNKSKLFRASCHTRGHPVR